MDGTDPQERGGSTVSAALLSATVAATSVLLLALLELPNIPKAAFLARPVLVVSGALRVIQETLRYSWMNVLCLLVIVGSYHISYFKRPGSYFKGRGGDILRTSVLAAAVGYTYWVLQLYEPFAGYPPFVGGLFALWLASSIAAYVTQPNTGRKRRTWYHHWDFFLALSAVVGAGVLSRFNYRVYKGLYPTLHLSAFLVTHLLLGLGMMAAVHAHPAILRHLLKPARWLGRAALCLVTVALLLLPTSLLEGARPHVTAYTMAGQSRAVFHRFESAGAGGRPHLPPDDQAEARFLSQSGLPALEEDFLRGKNVLLVTWEATRFDHTSLSGSKGTHTPELKKFFEQDKAFSFTRAYSASSGTLHSISSVLGMSYPSSLRLETWKKPWHGELLSDGNLVPEVFARSGYDTFRITHAFRNCFRKSILGFHHGFSHQQFFVEEREVLYPDLDKDIADAALAHIKKLGDSEKPFFGWVFFGGPHAFYLKHYDDMPSESHHDRYVQELRRSDQEMGRLLQGLRDMGRLEDTVVIFFGDHGEEFHEHGGTNHKATVYTEVTHVPLLVYLPGKSGKEMNRPLSTYYVFPWLLRTGMPPMREAAARRITENIGPMMRATDGAAVIELIGHDRMMTSLVYEKEKFNYDFLSSMYEVYDVANDPLEQKDRFDTDIEMARRGVEKIDRYLTVRAARAQYILKPKDRR